MKRLSLSLFLAVAVALGFGADGAFAASYQQYADTGTQIYANGNKADYQFYFHFDNVNQTWVAGSDAFFIVGTIDNSSQVGRYCGVHNADGTCNTMVWYANVVFPDGTKAFPRWNCFPNGSWQWAQH